MLLMILLLLWQQAAPPAAGATGVISGQLRGIDGPPAQGVRVAAADDSGTMVSQGQTDASGNYRLENIPPGRYYVTAGLIELPTYYPGVLKREEARAVTVAVGTGGATGVDFALVLAAGVRVSGRVQGLPPGVPPGFLRAILTRAGQAPPHDAAVGVDGAFAFERVTPGSYTLRVLPLLTASTAALPVIVTNVDVTGLVLSAPSILGRVTVEGGRLPVTATPIRVQSRSVDTATFGSIGPVDTDGVFLLSTPAGEHRISMTSLPFGYGVKSMDYGTLDLLQNPLKVPAGLASLTEEMRIVLNANAPGVTVRGHVNGLPSEIPLESRRIFMQSSVDSGQRTGETLVRADGTFEMRSVPPGTYTVRLIAPGVVPMSTSVLVENRDVGGIEINTSTVTALPTAAPIVAAPPQPLSGVLAQTPPPQSSRQPAPAEAGAISGRLRMSDGQPASGVRVAAVSAPQPGAAARESSVPALVGQTDASGNFRLENVPPGRYYVSAGNTDLLTYYPGATLLAEARVLTVLSGGTAAGIDFPVDRSGVRVSGRVNGLPAGVPPGYVRAFLIRNPAGVAEQNLQVAVAADGSFQFTRVSPGSYSLRLIANILNPNEAIPVTVTEKDIEGLVLSAPSVVGRVIIEGGGSLPVFPPAPAAVPIFALNPLALIYFEARRTDTTGRLVGQVNPDGVFLLPTPPGEYRVDVTLLPFGYSVKSITYGSIDLTSNPLKTTSDPASTAGELRVVLTSNAPGVSVSGRVNGLPPELGTGDRWLFLQSTTRSPLARSGEALLRPDGDFELRGVPPGTYRAIVRNASAVASIPNNLLVEDRDILGAEITVPAPPPGAAQQAQPPLRAGMGDAVPVGPRTFKVSGRVVFNAGPESQRPRILALFGSRGRPALETEIAADGRFEFNAVPSDKYDARFLPLMLAQPTVTIPVQDQHLTGLEIAAP